MTTSHNQRYGSLGISVGVRLCGCGRPAQKSQFFCGDECRFWAKVRKGPDCWFWTSNKSGGRRGESYGQFSITRDGKRYGIWAHQFAWELANGPVPDGLEVMHKCHNGFCVRPGHLEVGTHLKNVQDSAAAGHYNVSRPASQKITADQIYELRDLHRSGWTGVSLAARYGITAGFVSQLIHGTTRRLDAPLRPSLEQAG